MTATVKAAIESQSVQMEMPMVMNAALLNGVETLKWLVVPRAAWRLITTISIAIDTAKILLAQTRVFGQSFRYPANHAKVRQVTALDKPNFAGLSHAFTPVICRVSKHIAIRQTMKSAIISHPVAVNQGLVFQSAMAAFRIFVIIEFIDAPKIESRSLRFH